MATVIGLFESQAAAESVRQELVSLGIPSGKIRLTAESSSTTASATHQVKGFWEELKEMFTSDDDSHYADYYAEGTRRGGTLVTVDAPDDMADQAAEILRENGAVDIDHQASQWAQSGWTGYQGEPAAARQASAATANTRPAASTNVSANAAGKIAIPNVQEDLEVGKRQVQGGGVRIVRKVSEQPVAKSIDLHDEHVDVQRRPVNRELTASDLDDAFEDKTIEVTETSEVPVVAKTARVTDEVVVDKQATQRTEQVRDTVRRSDVQVERLPGKAATEGNTKTSEETSQSSSRAKTSQP